MVAPEPHAAAVRPGAVRAAVRSARRAGSASRRRATPAARASTCRSRAGRCACRARSPTSRRGRRARSGERRRQQAAAAHGGTLGAEQEVAAGAEPESGHGHPRAVEVALRAPPARTSRATPLNGARPVSGGHASPAASVCTSLVIGQAAERVRLRDEHVDVLADDRAAGVVGPEAAVGGRPAPACGTYTRVPRGITRRSVAIDSHSVTSVPAPGPNRSWYGSFDRLPGRSPSSRRRAGR